MSKNHVFISIYILCYATLSFANGNTFLESAKATVEKAISSLDYWDGPTTGPSLAKQKHLVFIASDLRNDGVHYLAQGVSEAITHTDWSLYFADARGSEVLQGALLKKAISYQPDGIVLGGIDASRHQDTLKMAKRLSIPVIGWHSVDTVGKEQDLELFTNITTDSSKVAEVAALLAILQSNGEARVAILTDPNYSIALLKSDTMFKVIDQCEGCKVVSLINLPLSQTADEMPSLMNSLLNEKEVITHILTINDLYIDYAIPSLEKYLDKRDVLPTSISAGDGSQAAYLRISKGYFQAATVSEPLLLQGWQIVDEFNRAFQNVPPSGYSSPVHLVIKENVAELLENKQVYDPDNGYRDAYLNIWARE
ncbi:substrate-binding domain-containing protein [Marinomonas sp. 15G1-11]|uniref:Substrate-binding domain-containing protein n=1 Tax=Marinomonas phaeophyticola TaxID=3004091 RepID=A0ABT4JW42_9GAMM|nr:substrate-binding domain-containing protein [Marinomonas sp. 15G1-11]MCZ2722570.1 substrate-binding domain-containing protein [Marinomonas sp. 15G1-11]